MNSKIWRSRFCFRWPDFCGKADRIRRILTFLVAALLVWLAAPVAGSTTGKPDPIPPFLSQGASPNLVLTLDDSTSMRETYSPYDLRELNEVGKGPGAYGDGAWFTCPTINRLYYNPDYADAYLPAKRSNGDDMPKGVFNAALLDPFDVTRPCHEETVNLTNNYRPIDGQTNCKKVGFRNDDESDETPAYYHEFVPENDYGIETFNDGSIKDFVDPRLDGTDRNCGVEHGATGDQWAPDQCFKRVKIPDDQQQAFANWFTYYRVREFAARTVLSQIMYRLPGDVRFSYQGVSSDLETTWADPAFKTLVDRFAPYADNSSDFYNWLFSNPSNGTTNLVSAQIRVGEFVSGGVAKADDVLALKAVQGTDLVDEPEPTAAEACGVTCRNNYHLIVTDGGWEDTWGDMDMSYGTVSNIVSNWPKTRADPTGRWIGVNQDGKSWDLPEGRFGDINYDPKDAKATLYADNNIGMLADAVFHYWATDLDTTAPNNVPPIITETTAQSSATDDFWNPANDPATWQHLTVYTIGIGVGGAVEPMSAPDYGEYRVGDETKTIAEDGFPDCNADPPYDVPDTYRYEDCTAVNKTVEYYYMIAPDIPFRAKVDDLYHAGINGRGGYYGTFDPIELSNAFESVLNRLTAVEQDQASNASVSIGAGGSDDGGRVYQALTRPTDWSGTVRGFRVSRGSGTSTACPSKPRGELCEDPSTPYQSTDYDNSIPTADSRTIFTLALGDGSASSEKKMLFKHTSANLLFDHLSAEQLQGLTNGLTIPATGDGCESASSQGATQAEACDLLDWLRGADVSGYRERTRVLGDILGSAPLVVGPPRQMFTETDYLSFRADTTNTKRKTVVYVGANDGMLHAFDADSADFTELFAYIPAAVYGNLSDLAEPSYGLGVPAKSAFVDGQLSVSDAKFTVPSDSNSGGSAASSWRTVLIGSFGGGAQGVYALDVTDPTRTDPNDVVLWEFTDQSGSDNNNGALDGRDMGYTSAPPAIVRIDADADTTNDPDWVALVNNGFDNTNTEGATETSCDNNTDPSANCTVSTTGNAVLYVLNLGGGNDSRIKARLDTGVGKANDPAGDGRTNGLSEVATLDLDADLIADLAYAGDLFGNVWRFNLQDLAAAPFRVFSAVDENNNPQPITTRIAFARHPSGGHMLLFGTGRFINTNDKLDREVQTFYGIWDKGDQAAPATRDDLLEHEFMAEQSVLSTSGNESGTDNGTQTNTHVQSLVRTSTKKPINAEQLSRELRRGWMIDLDFVAQGSDTSCTGSERVVVNPQVRRGRVVFVSTKPGSVCGGGGYSWVNALDAIDGSRWAHSPFDINGDGGVDRADLVTSQQEGAIAVSSIRLKPESQAIYSAPSMMDLGGGQAVSVISDAEGQIQLLGESSAADWRTWLQR